ncbi:hypothetical protein [Roseiconus lacunae]|uniref:Uncharacterized protein n=1 Tax=Roseiconus lacunae TaxID=2605694 RepID=A0ABT7PLV8_9BACT|nr:hypothetical protein [Roseiconus lacunae]MDM4017499.1 hypothetical protein [Roseiconus lacunae]
MADLKVTTSLRRNDDVSKSRFKPYRAPRQHGESLIEPSLANAESMLRDNQQALGSLPSSLQQLRRPARETLLRDSLKYTRAYRDVDTTDLSSDSIVMAGHQPTLFHPGVWFKNFALDRVAKLSAATAVNLVVDSDVAHSSAIRVPQLNRSTGQVQSTSVAFDQHSGGVPYEQSLIEHRELFDSFDARVRDSVQLIVADPLVDQLWHHAREAIRRCGFAGCALAQARHALEHDLGLSTLEVPQSVVCRTESFANFAMQVLCDLPRFHACYNDSADLYRQIHGIRSNAHPVPNLARDGDWFEAPFWLYGNRSAKRQAVWVRYCDGGSAIEIGDRQNRTRKIANANSESAYEALHALQSPEFKLRSRALVTTMYARLVLSDLFLHGIGGGKYDQLGDLISQRYWDCPTPQMMVLSATVMLPGHESFAPQLIQQRQVEVDRQLRDLDFHGESFRDQADSPEPELEQWITRKRQLLDDIPPHGQRLQWHREITAINRQLGESLHELRQQLTQERSRLSRREKDAALFCSREHSFCFYPLPYLQATYEGMLR